MKSLAKSMIIRGFRINKNLWEEPIYLFAIAHVKVEFIPVLKNYTIPILGSTNFVQYVKNFRMRFYDLFMHPFKIFELFSKIGYDSSFVTLLHQLFS